MASHWSRLLAASADWKRPFAFWIPWGDKLLAREVILAMPGRQELQGERQCRALFILFYEVSIILADCSELALDCGL